MTRKLYVVEIVDNFNHPHWRPGHYLTWRDPDPDTFGPAFACYDQTPDLGKADLFPNYSVARSAARDHGARYNLVCGVVCFEEKKGVR